MASMGNMVFPADLAAQVNAAISQHIGLWGSEADFSAVSREYGFATASQVRQVHGFAVELPVDWTVETIDAAAARVAAALREAYPWLSDENVRRLQDCFAYSWR